MHLIDSALFRDMGPQIGRFWQLDPKFAYQLSPYGALGGNPALMSGPLGDTTWIYNRRDGSLIGTVYDNLDNQIHFIDQDPAENTAPWVVDYGDVCLRNTIAQVRRRFLSVAFIGKNTINDMQKLAEYGNKQGHEIGFVAVRSAGGEIRLKKVSDKFKDEKNKDAFHLLEAIDRVYINERARKALGWEPKYDFAHVVARLQAGESLRSPLAQLTGSKGYHTESFVDGPYPIN